VRDRVPPEPGRRELRDRDNPALTGGDRRDRRVTNQYFVAIARTRRTIATFVPYSQRFVAPAGDGSDIATKCWFGRRHAADDAAA
jgi:hypothetical protein